MRNWTRRAGSRRPNSPGCRPPKDCCRSSKRQLPQSATASARLEIAEMAAHSRRMQRPRKLLILSAVLTILAAPALAQDAPEQPAAPYDADLQRLAEILGALQYLRTICNAKEGQKWRDQMQALID